MSNDGLRIAALKLNSLDSGDQAWLLAKFDEKIQVELRSMMLNLKARKLNLRDAGLESDFERTLRKVVDPVREDATVADEDAQIQKINAVGPARIASLLSVEPDWVIAAAIALPGWRGADACFACFPVERRLRISKLFQGRHPSPRLLEAIASILADRLASQFSGGAEALRVPESLPGGPGRNFWQRMGRWTR